MGKPAFVMFVGVEYLSDTDEVLLPDPVRKVYQTGFDDDFVTPEDEKIAFEVRVDDIEIEYIDQGRPDTVDPGQTIGFGVVIHKEWWDSGTAVCSPGEIATKAAHAMGSLTRLFEEWGLEARPRCLNACIWV